MRQNDAHLRCSASFTFIFSYQEIIFYPTKNKQPNVIKRFFVIGITSAEVIARVQLLHRKSLEGISAFLLGFPED